MCALSAPARHDLKAFTAANQPFRRRASDSAPPKPSSGPAATVWHVRMSPALPVGQDNGGRHAAGYTVVCSYMAGPSLLGAV